MNDTEAKAEQVRIRILRTMSPSKRLAIATGWSATLRKLTRAGLRKQFQGDSEDQLRQRFAERWLGAELAEEVYGPIDLHG